MKSKIGKINLHLTTEDKIKLPASIIVNYVDKNLRFIDESFARETGTKVLLDCHNMLSERGKMYEYADCIFSETGFVNNFNYILHSVINSQEDKIIKIYEEIFITTFIKYQNLSLTLNLLTIDKTIEEIKSFNLFYSALKRFQKTYPSKRVHIFLSLKKETLDKVSLKLIQKHNIFKSITKFLHY